jgi:hypothetical protein
MFAGFPFVPSNELPPRLVASERKTGPFGGS